MKDATISEVPNALFLDHVAGIAGDMFAASFLDSGLVQLKTLQSLPALLGLDDVRVLVSHVRKATMKATCINIDWDRDSETWKNRLGSGPNHVHVHGHEHASGHGEHRHHARWHTHYLELDRFLADSRLSDPVKEFARAVFKNLAEAEADAHGMSLTNVIFHEVGAIDSILDVVMAAVCVTELGPRYVYSTPVRLGRGLVTMEHGTHAVPPPAAARLARDVPIAEIPAAITRPNVELSTPTGLAILKTLDQRFGVQFVSGVPAGVITAQGMGAGTMDLGDYPNGFRVFALRVAEMPTQTRNLYESDRVMEIACTLDDETGERLGWLIETSLKIGALDAWIAPVTGKKGRPASVLTLLSKEDGWEKLANFLLRQSSTFGLRYRVWDRLILGRRFETRETPEGRLRYKIGMTAAGEVLKEKPEFEDVARNKERSSGA